MKTGEHKRMKVQEGERLVGYIDFEVHESGAFHYGNRTTTTVTHFDSDGNEKGDQTQYFDTRYFHGDLDNFIKYYEEEELRKTFHLVEE